MGNFDFNASVLDSLFKLKSFKKEAEEKLQELKNGESNFSTYLQLKLRRDLTCTAASKEKEPIYIEALTIGIRLKNDDYEIKYLIELGFYGGIHGHEPENINSISWNDNWLRFKTSSYHFKEADDFKELQDAILNAKFEARSIIATMEKN